MNEGPFNVQTIEIRLQRTETHRTMCRNQGKKNCSSFRLSCTLQRSTEVRFFPLDELLIFTRERTIRDFFTLATLKNAVKETSGNFDSMKAFALPIELYLA